MCRVIGDEIGWNEAMIVCDCWISGGISLRVVTVYTLALLLVGCVGAQEARLV